LPSLLPSDAMGLLHRAYARSIGDVWDTENRLLHALSLVRRPVAAQWLVTAACDMKCPHCYSAAGKRVTGELTTEEAKRLVIDPLVELGCPLLVLAGGELLLRRDIPELVAYARRRGLDWAMHTHGMHVPRHASLFIEHPPVLAAISLDGDRSFHDAFRGRAGSFDAAMEATEILADAGCREVVLGTTVTRDNADHVAAMFPLVASSRANSWGLHLFAPEGRGHDHAELFPTPGQLRRVAAFARRRRGQFPIELCNEWGSAGPDDPYYRDQAFACGAGRISLVVSATGDVLPCTTTDPSEREGNVRETPLPTLWREGFARFRGGDCGDRGECWLQSRNGVACAEDAFGPVARRPALWVERIPRPVMAAVARRAPRLVGPKSAAAVGLAAAGLVFLQGCRVKPQSDPAPNAGQDGAGDPAQSVDGADRLHWDATAIAVPAEFPFVLSDRPHRQFEVRTPGSSWARLRSALLACEGGDPGACAAAKQAGERARSRDSKSVDEGWDRHGGVSQFVDALSADTGPDFGDAIALLDALELRPAYDPALAAMIWRSVRSLAAGDPARSRQRAWLYGRLHQHARVVDAVTRAQAEIGPITMRPWLKKSGPSKEDIVERNEKIEGMMEIAAERYAEATATTWDTVSTALTVRGGAVELARAGRVQRIAAGGAVALNRLDVLWCADACTLVTEHGRTLSIESQTEVTLFDLHHHLGDDDRKRVEALVAKAVAGEPKALDAVERELPVAHGAIRSLLAERESPALQTLLVTFDE